MRRGKRKACLISVRAAVGAVGIGIVGASYTVSVRRHVHVVRVVQAPRPEMQISTSEPLQMQTSDILQRSHNVS